MNAVAHDERWQVLELFIADSRLEWRYWRRAWTKSASRGWKVIYSSIALTVLCRVPYIVIGAHQNNPSHFRTGCTIEELWHLLTERQPPIAFKLDDYIKPLAWKHLLKCAESSNAIQLFKLPAPREYQQTVFQVTIGSSLQWIEYKHPFPYCSINDPTTGVRGSCASYNDRENVTGQIVSEQLDLAKVTET